VIYSQPKLIPNYLFFNRLFTQAEKTIPAKSVLSFRQLFENNFIVICCFFANDFEDFGDTVKLYRTAFVRFWHGADE
jgi:hypothetical protein